MPFLKGNKEASKQKGKPKAKTEAWNHIVGWLVGDGGIKFKKILQDLSMGVKVSREEKEFLTHFKDLLEFYQPKLSRKTIVGDKESPLSLDVILREIEDEN